MSLSKVHALSDVVLSAPIVNLFYRESISSQPVIGLSKVQENQFRLSIPSVSDYLITSDVIEVLPMQNTDPSAVELYLFGSALGVLLHLRGTLPLHGSTVFKPDGTAAVFCGVSGAGKSTLVAALSKIGFSCLADDVTAIQFDSDGKAWALPGLSRVKLWDDAIDMLGTISPGQQIRPGIKKYYAEVPFCKQPLRVSSLYELAPIESGINDLQFDPIKGIERISTLLRNTYRSSYAPILEKQTQHMRQVTQLAPQLDMLRISRQSSKNTLSNIVDYLSEEWTSQK
jgi:hypothetical protein